MNTTSNPTCADRIAGELASREEQLREIMQRMERAVEQAEESEYYGDEEAIYELALSIDTKQITTICLSWGGPADYIDVTHKGGDISRMVYRFADWFDSATVEVERGSALWNYAAWMVEIEVAE